MAYTATPMPLRLIHEQGLYLWAHDDGRGRQLHAFPVVGPKTGTNRTRSCYWNSRISGGFPWLQTQGALKFHDGRICTPAAAWRDEATGAVWDWPDTHCYELTDGSRTYDRHYRLISPFYDICNVRLGCTYAVGEAFAAACSPIAGAALLRGNTSRAYAWSCCSPGWGLPRVTYSVVQVGWSSSPYNNVPGDATWSWEWWFVYLGLDAGGLPIEGGIGILPCSGHEAAPHDLAFTVPIKKTYSYGSERRWSSGWDRTEQFHISQTQRANGRDIQMAPMVLCGYPPDLAGTQPIPYIHDADCKRWTADRNPDQRASFVIEQDQLTDEGWLYQTRRSTTVGGVTRWMRWIEYKPRTKFTSSQQPGYLQVEALDQDLNPLCRWRREWQSDEPPFFPATGILTPQMSGYEPAYYWCRTGYLYDSFRWQ